MRHALFRCATASCIIGYLLQPASGAELLPEDRSIADAVDHYVDLGLKEANVTPATAVDDAAFIRRLTLDLAGRIPAVVETTTFIASKKPNKRQALIDRLINSPEFAAQQTIHFDQFMTQGNGSLKAYLQKAFQQNRSWDRVFRDVVTGDESDPMQKEAAAFLKSRVKDVDKLTNEVSIVFFGINVSCAKCHDHPLVDDWKQDHFYGMKSFFSRTFTSGKFLAERSKGDVSFKTTAGEARKARLMFLTGTIIDEPKVKPLSAKERKAQQQLEKKLKKEKKPPLPPKFSPRKQLIEVALKSGENGFFAKAIVNRVWHQYLGRGLVTPLDQMHSSNPPSHPELLDWLARDLIDHGYDLQRLVRGLVASRTYARGSRWPTGARPKEDLFAAGIVRPLTPTQMARSLSLATTDQTPFSKKTLSTKNRVQRITKAATTANIAIFEQPDDNFQVSANEALFFSNSEAVAKTYLNGGLVTRLEKLKTPEAIIQTAFQAILNRSPNATEKKVLTKHLSDRKERRPQAVRQVVWSLISGTEFRFNH